MSMGSRQVASETTTYATDAAAAEIRETCVPLRGKCCTTSGAELQPY